MKVDTIPLPRKAGGRAVEIWAWISLLSYVSQEGKPIFFKKQRISFFKPTVRNPQCNCEPTAGVGSLCIWSLLR